MKSVKTSLSLCALSLTFAVLPVTAHTAAPVESTTPLPAPADTARMEKARVMAAVMFPDGTFEKMLGPMMDKMIQPMMDQMMELPVRDLAKIGGIDAQQLNGLNKASLREVSEILDPAFQERMSLTTRTMFTAMTPLFSEMEPEIREGMAEAFSIRYSNQELDQINAFLATPTGSRFGSGFMELASDPAYLKRMQTMMPRIIDAMPAIMKQVTEAVASLPPARTWKQLSKDEKTRLEELLSDQGKPQQ